jgi:hypothetical protein
MIKSSKIKFYWEGILFNVIEFPNLALFEGYHYDIELRNIQH